MAAARMPAEWEPHAATLLAWPANTSDWPGKFQPIPWVFAEIARHMLPGERICLAVQSAAQEARARRVLKRAGADSTAITFVQTPLDRGWMRDISPCFVLCPERGLTAVRFGFNGWAKYDNFARDAAWAGHIARLLGMHTVDATSPSRADSKPGGGDAASMRVVLEGGAIDGNGRGSLLTTEECLLDPRAQVRNPGFSRANYEDVFRRCLGVTNVIWLGAGIAGDDTHGHVDDLCRFVTEDTVVLCQEPNPRDANHRPLAENHERLKSATLENGRRLNIIPLPMPAPVIFDGQRLPASYANFYIANGAVLVPTFNDPLDRIALGVLAEVFPHRRVVGIHARDLVWGLGTIHCLTHEVPVSNATA